MTWLPNSNVQCHAFAFDLTRVKAAPGVVA
jgi:hypothetical protein